jgi:hypothetical protein
MHDIPIHRLHCGAALAALHNASRDCRGKITTGEAQAQIDLNGSYVDYLNGCAIKANFKGGLISFRLFDRDNGEGAAYAALVAAGVTPRHTPTWRRIVKWLLALRYSFFDLVMIATLSNAITQVTENSLFLLLIAPLIIIGCLIRDRFSKRDSHKFLR